MTSQNAQELGKNFLGDVEVGKSLAIFIVDQQTQSMVETDNQGFDERQNTQKSTGNSMI